MSQLGELANTLAPLLPEGLLAATIGAVLLVDLDARSRASGRGVWVGIVGCAAAVAGTAIAPLGGEVSTQVIDAGAALARLLILAVTTMLLFAGAGEQRGTPDRGAWTACVLGSGLGSLLVAGAGSLVSLWLGLELVALSGYVLVAWRPGDRRAAEAGMKFVLFGGAASGLMLFGISHLYGLTGRFDFVGIGAALAKAMPLPVVAALCLAGVGVAYKLTIVPFHFYAPDVYQGAPPLGVAAVATVPKIAVAALLLRALPLLLPTSLVTPGALATALAAAASLSLLVAAFTALAQRDAKRVLAFSGIGHGGALLLALACLPGSEAGAAVGFYLLGYAAANVGAFVCLSVLERDLGSCSLTALAGAVQTRPWTVASLCLFLFSLAGVPPLAGFLGKWGVLQQALAAGFAGDGRVALAVAALVMLAASAIAAWSYLLIVRAAVFGVAAAGVRAAGPVPRPTLLVLVACAAATVLLGLWLDGLPTIARSLQP